MLPDLAGLYEMIDAYLDHHRARLIGSAADPAIHGDAFQRSWSVKERSDSAITLRLADSRFDLFRYQAEARYILREITLQVSQALTNQAQRALSFGAGFIRDFHVRPRPCGNL